MQATKRHIGPEHFIAALLILLAAASVVKTLFVGLEIDEEYALSIGWRLIQGDSLFYTMWEPHQLSALADAALMWPYWAVTGTTTGILLYMRVVTLVLKALLAFWFYRTMGRTLAPRTAFLAALAVFVYTPKWFLAPDYISQQFHFTLAAFLCFYGYYADGCKKLWRMVPGGIFLSLSVLAFPQSAFAAPVYLIGMFLLGRRREEKRILALPAGMVVTLLTCMVCAGAFLLYVLQNMSVQTLIARATLILNDPQYDFSFADRMALLGSQAADVGKFLAKPAGVALAVVAAGIARDISLRREHPIRNIRYWLNILFALFSAATVLLCLARALRDSSLDERFFCPVLVVAGLWFFRSGRGTARDPLFWLGYLPGVVAYLFILRSTLLGFSATFMYLTWPGLCAVLALALQTRAAENGDTDPCTPYAVDADWADGILLAFLAFLLVCRAFLVLTTGWKPANVLDTPLSRLSDGPAAGTWADEETADMYYALEKALDGQEGKKVLISTGNVDGLAFLMADGTLETAQASVISSTDSDSRFASYYLELPQKTPDIILYNHNCIRDLDEFHAWLENNFTISGRETVTYGSASLEVLTVEH